MTAILSSRTRSLILLASLSAALGACNASSGPTSSPAALIQPSVAIATPESNSSPDASATTAPSPSAAVSDAPSFTPVPTDIDPCTLLTQAEASTLAGVSLAAGTSSTAESNARMCSYGAEGSVVQLLVAVAPDPASAKAAEPGFKTLLEQGVAQAGIANPKLTEMADFDPGVDAAMVEGSASAAGKKLSAIALYALKGAVIVAISNIGVGSPVASSADLQAQAHTTLARLP